MVALETVTPTTCAGLRGTQPLKVSSLFTFCPLAVIRASQLTLSSILSLILSISWKLLGFSELGAPGGFLRVSPAG